MAWTDVTAVEARCDTCGQLAVDDDDARWFADRAAAERILSGLGWMFAGGAITCDGCVQKTACELVGHDWSDWVDRAYEWYVGRTRTCTSCDAIEGDPALPATAGRASG